MAEFNEKIIKEVSISQGIKESQVEVVLGMLEDGATVPFIARYRKEQTGALDEDQIRAIQKEYEYEVSLAKRKEDVIRLIDEKGLLTEELVNQINAASKLVEVEDLYRPFKEKKKTKATEAIKLGLEPLAKMMMSFPKRGTREEIVNKFIAELPEESKQVVNDVETAVTQAKYIIAEWISDNAAYRKSLRENTARYGQIVTKVKKDAVDEMKTYETYYDYNEPVRNIKPHRVLAINRAEDEKVISVNIESDKDNQISYLSKKIIRDEGLFNLDIHDAIVDSYKRLIYPSIEREVRSDLTDVAETQAISIFGLNLKNLLLQPPMKGKVVLGVDPAFRTGCKWACVDTTGKVLEKGIIFPNERAKGATVDEKQVARSRKVIVDVCKRHHVDIISIGNGTASRETESFIAETIKGENLKVSYVIVSEAGASVYSASEVAQEEFPDYHVEERSAVSIARRLQDPLSELVKIEPKAIGVGQYQHDVTPAKLDDTLNYVVSEAVNSVGVNVNTASKSLLNYVSGLNKSITTNIIKYREEFGEFKNREEIKKVPKLGPKAYEQAIGFLRIMEAENPLDMTSIHPESYDIANKIVAELDINVNDLGSAETIKKAKEANRNELETKFGVDKYTLDMILDAFSNPLRDPRDSYDTPILRSDVLHLEDVKVGMELNGTVRNVVDFGAFIDCGLKHDGLLHISKISKNYIKHPSDVLHVGDLVKVYVIGIDLVKQKLSLSLFKD